MEIDHALKERREENLLITFKISQNLVLVPREAPGRIGAFLMKHVTPATADVITSKPHLEVWTAGQAAGTFPG